MSDPLQFETPENVELAIQPAGLGTRFYAWFLDGVLTTIVFVGIVVLAIVGLASVSAASNENVRRWLSEAEEGLQDIDSNPQTIAFVVFGVLLLLWNLSGFFYYGLFELLMRGQTPGKKSARIRVVKADGFSLDAVSVLVRNVFRVVDHIPVLWLIPLLSARSQRLGDLVAGTLVVQDIHEPLSPVRMALAERPSADAKFQFPVAKLKSLRPQDVHAVETLLERWHKLDVTLRRQLTEQLLPALVKRLELTPPSPGDELAFFSDLLAAAYRQEGRRLG